MFSPSQLSLRQLLTIPYVVLVILASSLIGFLSFSAGSDAVDTLSDYVLNETVNRIAQAVDKHVAGSEAVLETAFPTNFAAPLSVKDDLPALRTRFWLATSVHRDPNNYAYYGDRNGQFFGLWRFSATEAELRLRTDSVSPRTIYRYTNINGELKDPTYESKIFDPRERPWFKAGQGASTQTWTAIYIDFKTLQLTGTRARRVNNSVGEFAGVVATDLSLERLNEFLKTLKLSKHGFAFIVEPDGNLVATSRGPHLRKGVANDNTRLNALQSEDPLIVATYKTVKELTAKNTDQIGSATNSFTAPDGSTIQAGYVQLRDNAGLNWIVAVAVPRADFMEKITNNLRRTVIAALAAACLIALVGLGVLNFIARDLKKLANAAASIADGDFKQPLPSNRTDEIGDLAKSFANMQQKLFTDRLTGLSNRAAVTRKIEDRISRHRRSGDLFSFAVLFIDLNKFKSINDQYGHETGDKVLIEIGRLLISNLRDVDMAARFGGDEFIVVLDRIASLEDGNEARVKIEKILASPLRALENLLPPLPTAYFSAAVGIAVYPDNGETLSTLLEHADRDMYARKQARKST